jgi:Ca2+-transporting ATPase
LRWLAAVFSQTQRARAAAAAAAVPAHLSAGDNIHTARHIARECGILTEGGVALEGPEFRHMPIHDLLPLLPKLQVRRTTPYNCA